MIKATELRIGNLLRCGPEGAIECSVKSLVQLGADVSYVRGSPFEAPIFGLGFVEYKDMEPIPLTPEILEKCGFEKGTIRIDEHGLLKILPDGRYEIVEFTDAETYRSYDNKIEYLHQLQNLFFALADEFELEVKL